MDCSLVVCALVTLWHTTQKMNGFVLLSGYNITDGLNGTCHKGTATLQQQPEYIAL